MSDSRLRKLEQSFRTSGLPEDERSLLRYKLNKGLISESQLQLAAYCGHASSQAVLKGPVKAPKGLKEWAQGALLEPIEIEVRIRLIAICYVLAYAPELRGSALEECIVTVIRQVLNPELDLRERIAQLNQDCRQQSYVYRNTDDTLYCLWLLGFYLHAEQVGRSENTLEYFLLYAVDPIKDSLFSVEDEMDCDFSMSGSHAEMELLSVVKRKLIPWALGYHDPLVDLLAKLEQNRAT